MAWQELAKAAASYAAEEYTRQKEAAQRARELAAALESNNQQLIAEIEDLLQKQFTDQKRMDCETRIRAVKSGLERYESDTRLTILDDVFRDLEYLIPKLEEEDIRLVGLRNWVIVADLMILCLKEKAVAFGFQSSLTKNRAREYL